MTVSKFSTMTNAELACEFATLAQKRGLAVLDSNVRNANKAFDGMWEIRKIVSARGNEARSALVPLLDHPDRFVRYYAAKNLLAVAPERARAIIEWNHKYWFDALAFDAGMTLHNLDTGLFKPD